MLGLPKERVAIHLSGCPEDPWFEEYYSLPWWKRIFSPSPKECYEEFLRLPPLPKQNIKIPDFGRAVISKHNWA